MKSNKKSVFALGAVAALAAIIAFAASFSALGTQASAQQQQSDPHHPDQAEDSPPKSAPLSNNTMLQFFSANGMSLVNGVRITGISQVGQDHITVNMSYLGEGTAPGVSIVVFTNGSPGIMGMMSRQQNSMMMGSAQGMMMDERSQLPHQEMQNSTTYGSMSMQSMQSGSNYLDSGWPGAQSNTATVLVQLDGNSDGGHIMVMVVPFMHH